MSDEQNLPQGGGAAEQAPVSVATAPEAGNPAGAQPEETKQPSESLAKDSRAQSKPDNDSGATEKATSGQGILSATEAEESADAGTLGAPEEGYKFEDSPESDVHFDAETREAFAEVAKELNLSQDAAQKVITKMEPALVRRVESLRKQWGEASQTDQEFGGAAFKTNVKAISKTYMATTTPELREAFRASGLDSHPEVLRHFYRLSKVLGEGRFVSEQGSRDGGDRSGHLGFYKGMNP